MEGFSGLGQNTSKLYGVFSKAESVSFSGASFLFWWNTNKTQFLFNKGFVSKD